MINASNLPDILAAAVPVGDDHCTIGGEPRYLASVAGHWTVSPDSDLFHIHEADLLAIKSAGAGSIPGTLSIGGVYQEISGYRSLGVRWVLIQDPEE
jgi:hypothetical protein